MMKVSTLILTVITVATVAASCKKRAVNQNVKFEGEWCYEDTVDMITTTFSIDAKSYAEFVQIDTSNTIIESINGRLKIKDGTLYLKKKTFAVVQEPVSTDSVVVTCSRDNNWYMTLDDLTLYKE